MKLSRFILIITLIALPALAVFAFMNMPRGGVTVLENDDGLALVEETINPPATATSVKKEGMNSPLAGGVPEGEGILPSSFSIKVPFIVQAPLANWGVPFNHACEEASLLMLHHMFTSEPITPQEANQAILDMVDFEIEKYGYHEDTAAGQTAILARDYFGYETEARYDITLDDIKREIVAGNPVIVPTAGKLLQNPYFKPPGPDYHMVVITGYTPEGFITNDPGTKRGENLFYTYDILEAAILDWELLDWDTGNGQNGRSAMVIVKKP